MPRAASALNTVVPGLMFTPLVSRLADKYAKGDFEGFVAHRHNQVPMGRMGDAWDVAHAVLFLASRREPVHHRPAARRRRRHNGGDALALRHLGKLIAGLGHGTRDGRLAGKVAIVTGAGSVGPGWGNGRAIDRALRRGRRTRVRGGQGRSPRWTRRWRARARRRRRRGGRSCPCLRRDRQRGDRGAGRGVPCSASAASTSSSTTSAVRRWAGR